jgi:hypothetical protein
LAVIQPGAIDGETSVGRGQKSIPSGDALEEMNLGSSDAYNIVITARPRGSLPTPLWNSSYFLFAGEPQDRP